MVSVNKVFILGRLGKDPELAYTPTQLAVCTMTVATSEKIKNETKTQWHRVIAFGKKAEVCSQYLKKGNQVWIEGQIQTRSWDDKNGQKRYVAEVMVQEFSFLDNAKSEEKSDGQPKNPEQKELESFMSDNAHWAEDEIPF